MLSSVELYVMCGVVILVSVELYVMCGVVILVSVELYVKWCCHSCVS